MVAAVAHMWESGFFTDEKLIEWEKKMKANQNWEEVQSYFGELYHNHKQYSRATAKKAWFNDCLNNTQEDAANKKIAEQNDAAMMFAMMQQQHKEQVNQMKESNKAAMDMMWQ